MTRIVVDASALIEYLFRAPASIAVETRLRDEETDAHAPALIDVEVASVIRRGLLARTLDEHRAGQVVQDLLDLPLARHGHEALVRRALTLRENLSPYDAVYVALAERLGAALVTADSRLARAARDHTDLEVAVVTSS